MRSLLNSILVFILLWSSFSCERKGYRKAEDLSNKVTFNKTLSYKKDSLEFRVQRVFLYEPDKRRNGLVLNPDNTSLTIEINIKNNSTKDIRLPLKYNKGIFSTRFYGCFSESRDCFELVDFSLPMSLMIERHSNINLSLGSLYFDFESLFGLKDDYTNDMLKLIEGLSIKYYNNDNLIVFLPDEDTKLIKINTY